MTLNKSIIGEFMTDEFESEDGIYENQEEIDDDANLLYEMIATIEDELREGSTLFERHDSFKEYFEKLFNISIDNIELVEETISTNSDLIDSYNVLKDELIRSFDNYFGITFDNTDKVYLEDLYSIYRVVYLDYVRFLCNYALGKGIDLGITKHEIINNAIKANMSENIDISDAIIGQYILNEDEFNSDNIAKYLTLSDPGNIDYTYLFGEGESTLDKEDSGKNDMVISNVVINNEAFRLRVKYEYSNPAMKYLFELTFTKFVNNLQGENNG
jgi:hypothetical protein